MYPLKTKLYQFAPAGLDTEVLEILVVATDESFVALVVVKEEEEEIYENRVAEKHLFAPVSPRQYARFAEWERERERERERKRGGEREGERGETERF
jgi:hypothetical protein